MSFPRPVRAVIFDMDGLLCDTETLFRDVMMEAAQAMGSALPLSVFFSMVGTPDVRSRQIALDHFGADFPIEAYWEKIDIAAKARLDQGVALMPGVLELLEHLESCGIPRAICTSSSHGGVTLRLERYGVPARMQAIVAKGDYTHGKPHPEPYLMAAAKLGVAAADCLALEDSHHGIRSARAAGMMAIMAPDLLPPTEEIAALCVAVVKDLHEVRALLAAHP